MSKVPQKRTKQELLIAEYLYARGFRYRKNYKSLPGSPDLTIHKQKLAIFIHGCFWHGHSNCSFAKRPTTNSDYWNKKLDDNRTRDQQNINKLTELGWNVFVIWQCELRNKKIQELTTNRLLLKLNELTLVPH